MRYIDTVVVFTAVFVCFPCTMQGAPLDTGFIEWLQPDNTTFVARAWGDEFFWWMETEDGYRIVQSSGDWFYYATLDEQGEFAPTSERVGIDDPTAESYQLDRSASRIAEIQQQVAEATEQIALNAQWFEDKQAQNPGAPVVLRIGVIFVEFQDFRHYAAGTRPNGYLKSDFDSMLFSQNWYNIPQRHPESDSLYGSFRDYWYQMSRGQLIVQGTLINPPDANGVPRWILLDSNRIRYAYHINPYLLASEGFQKAIDSNTINPGQWPDPEGYDKYIYVFAQNEPAGYRITHGHAVGGTYIQCPERIATELFRGENHSFAHMGTYAHEFGHNIGFQDEYCSRGSCGIYSGNTCLLNFDLMAWGLYNGPDRKGACPATLSPWYRIDKGWISSIPLPSDTTDFTVEYDFDNPRVYRIDPAGAEPNEHYLIETRLRQGFDLYTPTSPDSFVYQPGTLLVWHHNIYSSCYDDRIRLTHADNTREWGSFLTDFFPSDPISNRQSLNDLTIPRATLGSADPAPGPCRNERPAHFSLNGIQKLGNGNTLIDTVIVGDALEVQTSYPLNWNLASVPLYVAYFHRDSVWRPDSIGGSRVGNPFIYDPVQGYVAVTELANGPGYWVKFSPAPTISYSGGWWDTLNISVGTNWNIIGSTHATVDTEDIQYVGTSRASNYFKYNNGYQIATTIEPGFGYWVKFNNAGTIRLIASVAMSPSGGGEDELATYDKFTIMDAEGKQQDLYVRNGTLPSSFEDEYWEMPPAPPEEAFDVRLETDMFVKTVEPTPEPVDLTFLMTGVAFPATLTWQINPDNGITYTLPDSGSGLPKISAISGAGSLSLSHPVKRMQLRASAATIENGPPLPTEYRLAQNYPNPFNPETRIHFELPHDGHVRLVVYDVLGREVATLVDEVTKAGRYDVAFNATNLASGVYFYQLQAGGFNDVKKLVVLR
jgi:M6 family metalloprotease-like protein